MVRVVLALLLVVLATDALAASRVTLPPRPKGAQWVDGSERFYEQGGARREIIFPFGYFKRHAAAALPPATRTGSREIIFVGQLVERVLDLVGQVEQELGLALDLGQGLVQLGGADPRRGFRHRGLVGGCGDAPEDRGGAEHRGGNLALLEVAGR